MLKSTVLIFSWVIYILIAVFIIKKRVSFKTHIIYFLFFSYINSLIAITLFPLPIQPELISDMIKEDYLKDSYIPLSDIKSILETKSLSVIFRQIFGNIILFMPLGFFYPLITKKVNTYKKAFILGLATSVLVESSQKIISLIIGANYKITSVDDVILNTMGAIIGFFALKITAPVLNEYIDVNFLIKNESSSSLVLTDGQPPSSH